MTVKQLIEALSAYPEDMEVLIYGDECDDDALEIIATEERVNPYKGEDGKDFLMLCVDYRSRIVIGDLI